MSSLMYFLTSGKYKRLFILDKHLEILRDRIRTYQEMVGEQRIEWLEQCVVGKFIHFRKYDYDERGLKEFLDERGLLPVVSTIKWRELSVEEQNCLDLEQASLRETLKFIPNNEYSIKKDSIEDFKIQISNLDINDLVWQWKLKKVEYKTLLKHWNWICLNSPKVLSNSEGYKQYGTVCIKRIDPILDVVQVFNKLGRELFLKHCNLQDELIITYGLKGYYSLKEVRKFRSLVDIVSRYYLMEAHEERRVREMLENKLRRYSVISQIENE